MDWVVIEGNMVTWGKGTGLTGVPSSANQLSSTPEILTKHMCRSHVRDQLRSMPSCDSIPKVRKGVFHMCRGRQGMGEDLCQQVLTLLLHQVLHPWKELQQRYGPHVETALWGAYQSRSRSSLLLRDARNVLAPCHDGVGISTNIGQQCC